MTDEVVKQRCCQVYGSCRKMLCCCALPCLMDEGKRKENRQLCPKCGKPVRECIENKGCL